MINSCLKILPFLVCQAFLLLLFLLGDSYLGVYLIGIGSIIFLTVSEELSWKKVSNHGLIFLLLLMFMVFLVMSFSFSHSLPMSLSKLLFYFFSFSTFIAFLLLKKTQSTEFFLNKKLFAAWLIMVTLVVAILSGLLFVFPQYGILLPGKNLIFATYGHNHLAALLIIVLPLSWWFAIEKYLKKKSKLFFFLPIFFTLMLVASYGRITIFIGFVQVIVLVFLLANRRGYFHKAFLKQLLSSLLILFTFSLLALTYFSIVPQNQDSNFCSQLGLVKKICKPLATEFRPEYWLQAWRSVRDYPIFGYGPGTFFLISSKYQSLPWRTTASAHNAFFEMFAESGILVGTIFSALIIKILIDSYKIVKRSLSTEAFFPIEVALGMGLISMFANVLLDFDWNYLGIFSLFLIFSAILLRQVPDVKTDLKGDAHFILTKSTFTFVQLFLVACSILYVCAELLIFSGKKDLAAQLVPYFQEHMSLYLISDDVSDQAKSKVFNLHEYNPKAYAIHSTDTVNNPELNLELRRQLLLIDPWEYINIDLIDEYLKLGQYQRAEDSLRMTINFIDEVKRDGNEEVVAHLYPQVASQAKKLADYYYSQNEFELAAPNYVIVSNFQPDLIHDSQNLKNLIGYLVNMSIATGEPWTSNKYLSLVSELDGLVGDLSDYESSRVLLIELQESADNLVKEDDYSRAAQVLVLANELFPSHYWTNVQLSNMYEYVLGQENLAIADAEELTKKALVASQDCLDRFEQDHDDCQSSLERIQNQEYDSQQYWTVSKFILSQ